jgi:hypothetical protein
LSPLNTGQFLSLLEKVKAGLGAAGLSAIGADLLLPRLLASTSLETYGLTALVAVIAAALGAYYTDVSKTEAVLETAAKRESVSDNGQGST